MSHSCDRCGRKFASEASVAAHHRDKHSKPTPLPIEPICIECGNKGELVDGQRIYPHRPDLYAKRFYLCACGAYCGCHPGTTIPLGNPCGPVTRKARSAAHAAFDPLWKRGVMSRPSAYAWLTQATGIAREQCHIGMMTAEQANLVVRLVRERGRP